MRIIHDGDCDFSVIGICTCGAVNKARRQGDSEDLKTHNANLKKFKALLQCEKDAAALAPADRLPGPEQAPPTGGATGTNV